MSSPNTIISALVECYTCISLQPFTATMYSWIDVNSCNFWLASLPHKHYTSVLS